MHRECAQSYDKVLVHLHYMSDILIPIVDTDDNILTYKLRSEIDTDKDIYRVSSLWITNDKNELLLGQRSFNKRHYPGVWDVAVAGTVEKGETYETNIMKELKEELGVTGEVTPGPKVRVEGKYNMFIQWFFFKTNQPAESFQFERREIEQLKWYSKPVLIEALQREPDNFMAKDMSRWIDTFWK